MSDYLLHNAKVVLPREIVYGGIVARDGKIVDVFAETSKPVGFNRLNTIDACERHLAPGFIDIHIHGSAGVDVQDTDQDGLASLSKFLLSKGITGYFPTFVPADPDSLDASLHRINSYTEKDDGTEIKSRILGVHFEGPFVSKRRCGALHTEHFRTYDGDPRSVEVFTTKAAHPSQKCGAARLMTIAPEIDGAINLIRELTGREVRCFIGHSTADTETLDQAAETGARHITHFPNALEPLHHRKPGAVAWGLVRRDITMDCIADLEHIDPLMLRLIYQAKGESGMSLISDAIKPAGLGDGVYEVWGDRIAVTNGRTWLANDQTKPLDQRTIAGSVITLDQCVRNMTSLGVPLNEAVQMATLQPARAAGIDTEYGSIEVGKRADLVLFEEDLSGICPALPNQLSDFG
jgi:N-acetylglucosamine-6-phosphate deacetylase